MTALRQEAINFINQVPEDKLAALMQVLRKFDKNEIDIALSKAEADQEYTDILSKKTSLLLKDLWDNDKDAAYDKL